MTRRVLIAVETTEACTTCDATFTAEEQHAFDPENNDHCPKCGEKWCLTTYYGNPELAITGGDLDVKPIDEAVVDAVKTIERLAKKLPSNFDRAAFCKRLIVELLEYVEMYNLPGDGLDDDDSSGK